MNNLEEALSKSKQERESIKSQMYDASKRLTELEGVIGGLQYALDNQKNNNVGSVTSETEEQ